MKVRISLDMGVEVEDCDEAAAHRVELSLASFKENLEAVLASYLASKHPDAKFTFRDEEGEEWK